MPVGTSSTLKELANSLGDAFSDLFSLTQGSAAGERPSGTETGLTLENPVNDPGLDRDPDPSSGKKRRFLSAHKRFDPQDDEATGHNDPEDGVKIEASS